LNSEPLSLDEGWFATRDLGEWTQNGSLRILGRKDRLFISGGENIQPEEIERALCTLPGILFARVDPIPDPEFGQRPIATIHDTTQKYTLETVRHHLQPLLPSFKLPVRLFSSTRSGKG
jgi:O-succinylbenzoic acid--CoA ligase